MAPQAAFLHANQSKYLTYCKPKVQACSIGSFHLNGSHRFVGFVGPYFLSGFGNLSFQFLIESVQILIIISVPDLAATPKYFQPIKLLGRSPEELYLRPELGFALLPILSPGDRSWGLNKYEDVEDLSMPPDQASYFTVGWFSRNLVPFFCRFLKCD